MQGIFYDVDPEEMWYFPFSLEENGSRFLSKVMREFRASSGTLAIMDPHQTRLRVIASSGLFRSHLWRSLYLPLQKVSAHVLKQGEPVCIDVSRGSPLPLTYRRTRDASSVCLPLRDSRERIVGILSLNKEEGFFDSFVLSLLERSVRKFSGFIERLERAVGQEHAMWALEKASRIIRNITCVMELQKTVRKILRAFRSVVPTQYAVLFVLLPNGESATAMSRRAFRLLSPRLREKLGQVFAPLFQKRGLIVSGPQNISGLQDVLCVGDSLKVLVFPLYWGSCFLGAFLALVENVPDELSRTFLVVLGNFVTGILRNLVFVGGVHEDIERERLRIARDIHDRIAQDLAGAEMYCKSLREMLLKNGGFEKEKLSLCLCLEGFLSSCTQEVRKMVRELRENDGVDPSFSLKDALLSKLDRLFGCQRVPYVLKFKLSEKDLPSSVRREIFFILGECLVNVWKHAQATSLKVKVGHYRNRIYLSVWDNGKGFCPEKGSLREYTFGLQGITERVVSSGGIMRIKSAPYKGTRIGVMIPGSQ